MKGRKINRTTMQRQKSSGSFILLQLQDNLCRRQDGFYFILFYFIFFVVARFFYIDVFFDSFLPPMMCWLGARADRLELVMTSKQDLRGGVIISDCAQEVTARMAAGGLVIRQEHSTPP